MPIQDISKRRKQMIHEQRARLVQEIAARPRGVLSQELAEITGWGLKKITNLLIQMRSDGEIFSQLIDEKRRQHKWLSLPVEDVLGLAAEKPVPEFHQEHSAWIERVRAGKPRYNPWGGNDNS